MKLGISMACYRWELYPHLHRGQPDFLYNGRPLLYFSSIPDALPEEEGMEWLINHIADLGLSVLYGNSKKFQEPEYRRRIRKLLEEKEMEFVPSGAVDWVATGDEAEQDRAAFSEELEVARALGARVIDTTHTGVSCNNHFTKDPPIERQIEIMIENFKRLSEIAEDYGIVIALENHLDYRCSEIAQVIEGVDSPWLQAMLDTGNSVGVIEDPVDAARSVAPYTVMVHIKDFRIQAMSVDAVPKIFLVPLGRGQIDLETIMEILQEQAPDPENLRLCIEAIGPWEQDSDLWVRENIRYIREHFTQFLTS